MARCQYFFSTQMLRCVEYRATKLATRTKATDFNSTSSFLLLETINQFHDCYLFIPLHLLILTFLE